MNAPTHMPLDLQSAVDRRGFFRQAGGGIVMMLALEHAPAFAQAQGTQPAPRPSAPRAAPGWPAYPTDFNAYLVIGQNGRVTVYSGKVEMGQGVLTSQAQMLAEELGADLDAIDMVLGDTGRCPWDMGTFGSLTTRMFGPALRAAGAQARAALVALASERLQVPAQRLQARGGRVFVADDPARAVGFGELSRGARIARVVDREAVLRAASEFSVMGTSPRRLDALEKVTGAARYTADIRLPGMLHARILRPPAHGARLLRVDTASAAAMPGVQVVRDGELVAVLHADPEAADAAHARLAAQWSGAGRGEASRGLPDAESIFDHIEKAPAPRRLALERGAMPATSPGTVRIENTFRKGYVAHAPLETHAAVAEFREGRCTVWASTQTPFPTRDLVARALQLSADEVRVITPYLGGGFGGKSASGQAVEAARLARIAGRPVQVMRTRQEEFFLDTFDPACVVRIASMFDAQGRISAWDATVHAAGGRGSELLYEVPNARIELVGRTGFAEEADGAGVHPFATGPWRAPGANMNVFARESQIDVLAAAAKQDPIAFRMRHLSEPRLRRVLQAAADAFGWQPAPAPTGRGLGVALSLDAGTYVATIAQVEVERSTGAVKVVRMTCAQDMGLVVNPTGARIQAEGGLTMGVGYALSEELRFRGGEILDRNFDSYLIPRFSHAPKIEVVLVRNDALAPQGGGEPAITTAGAAIANAIFDGTKARLLRLPMTPARVRAALAGAA